jgi:hypothetical protein
MILALQLLGSTAVSPAEASPLAGVQPLLTPPDATAQMTAWILRTHDNGGLPFIIVDKPHARAYAFSASGRPTGEAPVLLGLAFGDNSAPGVGDKPLSAIPAEEKTTPAGRFAAIMGRNAAGHTILWVDYAAAISLHVVVTANPRERRLERLASATIADNRISFGCINVPPAFFNGVVVRDFAAEGGIVYVLPDTLPLETVFKALPRPPSA